MATPPLQEYAAPARPPERGAAPFLPLGLALRGEAALPKRGPQDDGGVR